MGKYRSDRFALLRCADLVETSGPVDVDDVDLPPTCLFKSFFDVEVSSFPSSSHEIKILMKLSVPTLQLGHGHFAR